MGITAIDTQREVTLSVSENKPLHSPKAPDLQLTNEYILVCKGSRAEISTKKEARARCSQLQLLLPVRALEGISLVAKTTQSLLKPKTKPACC